MLVMPRGLEWHESLNGFEIMDAVHISQFVIADYL